MTSYVYYTVTATATEALCKT